MVKLAYLLYLHSVIKYIKVDGGVNSSNIHRFLIELNEKKERGEVEDCERRYGTKDQLKANFNYWRSAGGANAQSAASDYGGAGADSDGASEQGRN